MWSKMKRAYLEDDYSLFFQKYLGCKMRKTQISSIRTKNEKVVGIKSVTKFI